MRQEACSYFEPNVVQIIQQPSCDRLESIFGKLWSYPGRLVVVAEETNTNARFVLMKRPRQQFSEPLHIDLVSVHGNTMADPCMIWI